MIKITDYAGIAGGMASNVYTGLMWVLFLLLVGAVVGLIVYYLTFNIKLRLRNKTSTHDQIDDCKAKYVKDSLGVERVQVFFRKKVKYLPMPPPEAIGLTKRGKHTLEVEIREDGLIRYIIKNTDEGKFKPLNTNDRMFYIEECRKAEMRKKKTLSELIMALAPVAAVIIIFVMALVFWEDVTKPSVSVASSNAEIAKMQKETTIMLKEIIKKEQVIRDEEGGAPPD